MVSTTPGFSAIDWVQRKSIRLIVVHIFQWGRPSILPSVRGWYSSNFRGIQFICFQEIRIGICPKTFGVFVLLFGDTYHSSTEWRHSYLTGTLSSLTTRTAWSAESQACWNADEVKITFSDQRDFRWRKSKKVQIEDRIIIVFNGYPTRHRIFRQQIFSIHDETNGRPLVCITESAPVPQFQPHIWPAHLENDICWLGRRWCRYTKPWRSTCFLGREPHLVELAQVAHCRTIFYWGGISELGWRSLRGELGWSSLERIRHTNQAAKHCRHLPNQKPRSKCKNKTCCNKLPLCLWTGGFWSSCGTVPSFKIITGRCTY